MAIDDDNNYLQITEMRRAAPCSCTCLAVLNFQSIISDCVLDECIPSHSETAISQRLDVVSSNKFWKVIVSSMPLKCSDRKTVQYVHAIFLAH